jgi:hypothetical protein
LRRKFYCRAELALFALELSMRQPHGKQAHRCFSQIPHTPPEQPPPRIIPCAWLNLVNFNPWPLILHMHQR